jgi:indolepyruvate ferredoxin oxidoreductase
VAYQDAGYAERYLADVLHVHEQELARTHERSHAVTDAYARGLFKLMAYKDEYEVARLHLDAHERARISEQFGPNPKIQILLHPPILKALGAKHKLTFGASVFALFRLLHVTRGVRGSRFDPFGYTKVRRLERQLIGEYNTILQRALAHLSGDNVASVVAIAELPDLIRGYEQVKLRNIDRFRTRSAELLADLELQRDREPVPLVVGWRPDSGQ